MAKILTSVLERREVSPCFIAYASIWRCRVLFVNVCGGSSLFHESVWVPCRGLEKRLVCPPGTRDRRNPEWVSIAVHRWGPRGGTAPMPESQPRATRALAAYSSEPTWAFSTCCEAGGPHFPQEETWKGELTSLRPPASRWRGWDAKLCLSDHKVHTFPQRLQSMLFSGTMNLPEQE